MTYVYSLETRYTGFDGTKYEEKEFKKIGTSKYIVSYEELTDSEVIDRYARHLTFATCCKSHRTREERLAGTYKLFDFRNVKLERKH